MNAENTNLELFSKAARYNSGRHLLDSGGSNGRHWQKPFSPSDRPLVTVDEYGATINTARFLADHLKVDTEIQDQFDAWAALDENRELSWFEAGEKFAAEVLELEQRARDNTYNGESDLDQCYVWEVYDCEGHSDWICAEDSTVTVIYIHTGADVRGGYAYPLFTRPRGEYSIPVDLCAGFYCIEERGTGQSTEEVCDHWQIGYSQYPFGELEKDCERFFFGKDCDTFLVKLKSGGVAKVCAEVSTCY